ncbi:hypothetical protein P7C71_g1666, partial [Lecanoromycetidae sp. Uapishka_2]
MLSEREDIAISQIAVYIPALVVALYVTIRHGFVRQMGWVYLVIFCVLRIAGAIMQVLSAQHPTNREYATWGAILGSIGLSPLLLAAIGLLKRVTDLLREKKSTRILVLRLLHIPCVLGLVLAIIGGTRLSSSDPSTQSSGQSFEKGGGLLFAVVFIGLTALCIVTFSNFSELLWGERRIFLAIIASLPLLAVRLLYTILADFEDNSTFSILDGNATVQLCMAVIEEFIITILFLVAGVLAPSLKNMQSEIKALGSSLYVSDGIARSRCVMMIGSAITAPLKIRGINALIVKLLILLGIVYFVVTFNSRQVSTNTIKDIDAIEIPRKIWQTWHTPAMLLVDEDKERARTWQERNPTYQYELLTDKGAESFVTRHFADDALLRDTFESLSDTILRADFLRYLVLLAEGGVYADVDVECKGPVDNWIPAALRGKVGVVLGIEVDRPPVENDKKLYLDYRDYIWGITNWTFMSKRGHPFMHFVAESVAKNLQSVAQQQGKNLSTMELSYKEVVDSTGPRAFTEAFLAYASGATGATGAEVTYLNATMLEEPKLIGDILLLPIRAMSTAEADREDANGAHSRAWPAVLFHWSAGTWKKTHLQKAMAVKQQGALEANFTAPVS